MKKLTPEEQAAKLEAAVNAVDKALQRVVDTVDAYPGTVDVEKLRKIEAFLGTRLGDVVQAIGIIMLKRPGGTRPTFSLDAPMETLTAPRTVLSVPAIPGVPPGKVPNPNFDPEVEARGGRLVGQKASTPADDDDVGFIEDED